MLLDPFIGDWTRTLALQLHVEDMERMQVSCQILYQLCKISGYKTVSIFLVLISVIF